MSTTLPLIPVSTSLAANSTLVANNGGFGGAERQIALTDLPGLAVSAKAFGATGAGVVNDGAAIQNAINHVSTAGGGTVLLSVGTYLTTSPLTVPAGVRLLGDGAVIISSAPSDGAKVSVIGSNVTIEGITFDGAKTDNSGSGLFGYGLVDIVRNNATAFTGIRVARCIFRNSESSGVRFLGNINGLTIQDCSFSRAFIDIFGEKAGTYIYQNVAIKNNSFGATWKTGTFSGAIKLKGDYDNALIARRVEISGNNIANAAEMGIEIFGGVDDALIESNIIFGSAYGISVNNGRNITVVNNKTFKTAYCGIEIAEGSKYVLVSSNIVDGYASAGVLGSTFGFITSGTYDCTDLNYVNNISRGAFSGMAFHNTVRTFASVNRVEDCEVLAEIKNSSNFCLDSNQLSGPCKFHVFLNCSDRDVTYIDVTRNTLLGTASIDNLIYYDGSNSHTLSNLRIAWNHLGAASYTSLSFNKLIPDVRCPNLQCFENYSVSGANKANWPDFTTNAAAIPPFSPTIQAGGIGIAGKTTVAVTVGGVRWVKVFSADYGLPVILQCHFKAFNLADGDGDRLNAFIAASPYGLNSSVSLSPSPFFSGIVEEVIYNNPAGGSVQEIWLKLKAASKAFSIDCHFSDVASGAVASPTLTGTEPTWASNSYRANTVEVDRSHAIQVPGIKAQRWIACGPRGVPALLKGRLHIRGPGDEGGDSPGRIAIFEKADGAEAVGINQDGELFVKSGLRLGASGSDAKLLRISSGVVTASFGTIGANDSASFGCSCPGARSSNNPSISAGFLNELPIGIVLASCHVSADDVVAVRLRNVTGSSISVGDISVRTTCFQF